VSNKRWLILAIAFLAAFAFVFSMQAAPPLIPTITDQFGLSHTQAAGIMLFVALPGIFLSIPAGFLVDRYGCKRLCCAGLILVCLGTFFTAMSPSFYLLEGSRFIVGVGGALLYSATPSLIFQWFTGKETGFALGIWALNMPLATVIAFNILNRAGLAYGWRYSFWIAGALALVILIVSMLFATEKRAVRTPYSLAPLRTGSIWILAAIWAAFNMAILSLTTWGVTLFINLNIPPVQAGFLAGLVMLLSLTTPLTGYIADRIGRRRILILLSTIGVTLCLAFIPIASGQLMILLILLGLFTALTPPSLFALPPELVGQANTGQGFGVLNTAQNFGVLIGPLIVGRVLDSTHSDPAAFFTMASFAALGVIFTLLLKAR
jgi:MFS family permease